MKQFMAFSLLLFLVALQLPKSWLHHHDHGDEHAHELVDYDHSDESLENDDCFACELTIDSSDGPMVPIRIVNCNPETKITSAYIASIQTTLELPYALRGPPVG